MPKNQINLISQLTNEEAFDLAIKALEGWGKYANELRARGMGADMSSAMTGFSNNYLISILKEHKKNAEGTKKIVD